MKLSRIHLAKTLFAMRLIALLTDKHDVARAIEQDMAVLA